MLMMPQLIAVAFALVAFPVSAGVPNIIAHRGASVNAPENTLAAFRLAWKKRADGIEGDFFLTANGEVVCIHDRTTKRTAGRNLEGRGARRRSCGSSMAGAGEARSSKARADPDAGGGARCVAGREVVFP